MLKDQLEQRASLSGHVTQQYEFIIAWTLILPILYFYLVLSKKIKGGFEKLI